MDIRPACLGLGGGRVEARLTAFDNPGQPPLLTPARVSGVTRGKAQGKKPGSDVHNVFPDVFQPRPDARIVFPDVFQPRPDVRIVFPDVFRPRPDAHIVFPDVFRPGSDARNVFPDVFQSRPDARNVVQRLICSYYIFRRGFCRRADDWFECVCDPQQHWNIQSRNLVLRCYGSGALP